MNNVYSSIALERETKIITAAYKERRGHEEDCRIFEKMRLMRRQIKRERASAKFAPFANGIDEMASEDIQKFAI